MKNHIPIEERLARGKSFKTDNLLKTSQLMKSVTALHKHFQKLSDEEIEQMWPSVDSHVANDNRFSVRKNRRIKDKEFLITLIARATQTIQAMRFVKEKGNIDLQDKDTQQILQQKSEDLGRNF